MTRRSTPAAKRDDDAFPVRVKLAVPPNGLGSQLNDMHGWLRENLPTETWAVHGARTIGGSALAVYFIGIEDAGRFIEAFPQARLATRAFG